MSTRSSVTLGTPLKGVENDQEAFKPTLVLPRSPPTNSVSPEIDVHAAPKKTNKTANINVDTIQRRPLNLAESNSNENHLTELEAILATLRSIQRANKTRTEATDRLEKVIQKMKQEGSGKQQVTPTEELKDKYSEILTKMIEFSEEIKGVRKELTEVKASIAMPQSATSEPTYAQITRVSGPKVKPNMLSMEEKHKLDREKKDRALYEITLSMRETTTETRDLLTTGARDDIKAAFQRVINEQSPQDKVIVQAVNTLGTATLKLHFRSKDEAAKIRSLNINWNQAYEGIKLHNPQYGIVVHGAPTAVVEDTEGKELIKQWEEQNDAHGDFKITRITPLRRNNNRRVTAHKSMIVFTENASAANEIITRGFFLNSQVLKAEKYAPHLHINQCYRCHSFGHKSTYCNRKEKCGRCGKEDHRTNECSATKPHCTNCKGDHEAWSLDCETRNEEGSRLHQLRTNSPALFST
jgi:hypothetical protein